MISVSFIIETTLLVYFAGVSFYNFLFAFAGLFFVRRFSHSKFDNQKFVILIPAYKEDGVILDVSKKAKEVSYPKELYDVVVIADSLKSTTVKRLKTMDVHVHEVSFIKSTKVKALNDAMAHLTGPYKYAVILDADNIIDPSFLKKANDLHEQGWKAIQGRRCAKNKDTTMAYLDGLSEEINNSIVCKGSSALRLSSSLKGSGMSFDYQLFKELLSKMESVGGFDRELELRFLKNQVKVLYTPELIVLDEKITKVDAFENQRKRWISSQFFYLRKYFRSGMLGLLQGRVAYFNSSILRNIQLPRLINLGLQVVLTLAAVLLQTEFWKFWVIIFGIHMIGTAMAIPREYYNKQMLKSLLSLPRIFIKMFALLFKLKGANKKFIHTPHGTN